MFIHKTAGAIHNTNTAWIPFWSFDKNHFEDRLRGKETTWAGRWEAEEGVHCTVQDCDRAEYKLGNQWVGGHCSGHRTGHPHQVPEICHTHAGGAKCTLYHILYYISTLRISKIYNPKNQSATLQSLNMFVTRYHWIYSQPRIVSGLWTKHDIKL